MNQLIGNQKILWNVTKAFVSWLMIGMICSGCEADIVAVPITMDISETSLAFNNSNDWEKTFSVKTNTKEWKASSSDPSWLSVKQQTGGKNGEVTVTANPNTAFTKKEATITIKGIGIDTRTIRVTIDGAPVRLEVAATELNFPAAGGPRPFDIISNTGWTLGIDTIYDLICYDALDWWLAGWLTFSKDKDVMDRTVTVTAAANPLIIKRTQTITVSGPPDVPPKTIRVTQDGVSNTPSLVVSRKTINFSASSLQEESFDITSNTKWTVKWDVDWFFDMDCNPYMDRVDGKQNGKIRLSIASINTSSTPRKATITVTGEGIQTPQYIEVTQAAATVNTFGNNIVAASSYGGGNGTQNAPYLINNAQQLKRLVNESNNGIHYFNTYFKLMADIEVTANEWIPIGRSTYFRGNFDGNGHYISGSLKSSRYAYFGFFGGLDAGARISNLTMNASVTNDYYSSSGRVATGAIAAIQFGASVIITNCAVNGTVKGGRGIFDFTGGILGRGQDNVLIQNCNVSNSITGNEVTGGIVAEMDRGEVSSCTINQHAIRGDQVVGGITGNNYYGLINNCTNFASVSNGVYVGGIVGHNYYGTIHTSLNTGAISGSTNTSGGLAGENNNTPTCHVYSCCTNRGTVNGQAANVNNQIGRGKAVETCPNGHTKR